MWYLQEIIEREVHGRKGEHTNDPNKMKQARFIWLFRGRSYNWDKCGEKINVLDFYDKCVYYPL